MVNALQQQEYAGVGYCVENIVAFALRLQDALIFKNAQLLADNRLHCTCCFGYLTDIPRFAFVVEIVEDAEP